MEALYSQQQQSTLQSKIWWVACNVTPFLIRSAVYQNTILLTITDLRTLWGTRLDQKKLMKDKEIFAKTLQVTSSKQLISLFQQILSNPEQKALYKFIKKTSGDLVFQIQKQIEVYPLTWKFQLIQLDCDNVHMMCKDIVNPLTRTLNAQQKRIQIMRRKMKILQQNLMKRMTESQKVYYKSSLIQDQQDMKLLVGLPKQQQFIIDLRLQNRSKFFFQLALNNNNRIQTNSNTNTMNNNNKSMIDKQKGNNKQKSTKVQKRVAGYNNQLNAQQIINQLQMKKQEQRQKKKKKKDRDFI